MGRLLIVLIPIEIAIREYWSDAESAPIAEWDRPVGKWEFRELFDQYTSWHEKSGKRFDLDWADWRNILDLMARREAR